MTTQQTITAALSDVRVHHATKAKAQRLEDALRAEYPGIEMDVETEDADGVDVVASWIFIAGGIEWSTEDKQVPELADVTEGLLEAGATEEDLAGEEGEEEDEEEGSRSVVREEYRAEYRVVSSNKQTNGDWLAETLTDLFWDSKTGFNVGGFEALLDLNGVDMSAPWAQVLGTKGGAGRFRMNGRQALEKRIAVAERFVCTDEEGAQVVITAETNAEFALWQVDNKSRHAGYLAKLAKAKAKEEAAEEEGGE